MDADDGSSRRRIDGLIAASRRRVAESRRAAAETEALCRRSEADRTVLEALAAAGRDRVELPADWGG